MTTGATNGRGRSPAKPLTGIREVARLAGVSLGTVSNVINYPDKVSPATRTNVEAVITRLDFVPNREAANLRRGHSKMLGLVVPDITNPFFAELARGAVDAARERGYVAVLCTSEVDEERELQSLELLQEHGVAGVLVTPVGQIPERLARLKARGTGVVLVDRSSRPSEFCSVSVDDVAGGRMAVAHLLESGATRVTLVNGPVSIRQCADRRRGARSAVQQAGLPREALVEIGVPAMTVEAGVLAAERMLEAGPPPPLVFCTNDLLAIGVQRVLGRQGVRVPGQVAVIGYDDIERVRDIPIPLSSMKQPTTRLGSKAAELLIDEIENPDGHRHQRTVFDPVMVPRESTAVVDT